LNFATKAKKVLAVDVVLGVVETINAGNIHLEEPDLNFLVRAAVQSGILDSLIARIDFGGIKTRSVFSRPAVENRLADVKSGKIDASYTIWSILAIDSWQRQFLPMVTADESPSRLGPLSRPPLTPRKFR